MPLVNATITNVTLNGPMVAITIGPETFQVPIQKIKDIVVGKAYWDELIIIQVLQNLISLGVNLTDNAAIRTAMIGMVVKIGS